MARRRRRSSGMSRQQWREKHQRDCGKGNHEWRPVNIHYSIEARCEHCDLYKLTRNLSRNDAERVREIAKTLRDVNKKVEALHPRRTFNKDGY